MKKNLIVTCVLCLAMFLVGINPCFVSANEMTDQENSDEYVAVLLSDTSEDFQNEIKKCKINTNELTLVNVIKEKAGNTAFQVLTVNGDQVERSIISYLDANARQQLVSKKDMLNNGAKNSSSGSLFVFGNYARIVITGSYTAVTPSWITAVLHQPYRVAFYYVPSVVLSMTDVTATYRTNGALYTLSTHGLDNAQYTHTITYRSNSVSANTTYSAYNYLNTTKGIDTTLSYWGGEYLGVEGKYGGVWFSESYAL